MEHGRYERLVPSHNRSFLHPPTVRVFSSPELILLYSKRLGWSKHYTLGYWPALENPGLQLTFSIHPVSVVWLFVVVAAVAPA
jgi:hypothetical protein